MSNKKESKYFFTPDGDDSQPDFKDIVSSSKPKADIDKAYSLSEFTGKGRYYKKKRGFFGKISNWWSACKTWKKSVIITSVSLILVVSIALGILVSMFDYNYNKISTDDLGFENIIDKNIVNVALFGIDTRSINSFEGNSDSIMILSLNTVTKKVKIISVMRDSFVPITYNGKTTYSKINSAYAKGGPELAIKTLNKAFGLDISEYATVNFFGMVDIIDAIGGIDAELTDAEVQPKSQFRHGINGCIAEICTQLGLDAQKHYVTEPGKQHLNGIQAVAYSRIRYVANIWGTNNDYGRTDRQRYVMEQLFNKAITLEKKSYVKLAKSLIPCSETSLSYNEIMGLAFDILLKSPTFEQTRVPQQEYIMTSPNTSAGSVVYYDLDFAAKLIHAFIYEDITPENYIEVYGVEKNDWYGKKVGYYTTSSSQSTSQETTSSYTPVESSTNIPTVSNEQPTESNPETPEDPENSSDSTEDPETPPDSTENPDDTTSSDVDGEQTDPPVNPPESSVPSTSSGSTSDQVG